MTPVLTIVIPVYKTPLDMFAACVKSVLAWEGDDLEVVAVVDSPGDPIEARAVDVAARDARVKVLRNEKNMGPSYSRNRGIGAARGEYVMMVDSDDVIDVKVCRRALDECKRRNLDFCAVGRVFQWQRAVGDDVEETHRLYVGSMTAPCEGELEKVLCCIEMSSVGIILSKRLLSSTAVKYPEDLRQNEDFVFMTSVVASASSVALWDEVGYRAMPRTGSLSANRNFSRYRDELMAADRVLAMIGDRRLSDGVLRFYSLHCYNQIFVGWRNVEFAPDGWEEAVAPLLRKTARVYARRFGRQLTFAAKMIVFVVALCPTSLMWKVPVVEYAFRAVRKLGWYYR